MIENWLSQSKLEVDCDGDAFKIEEVDRPNGLIEFLGGSYLSANVNPSSIERQIHRLRKSSRELGLDEIRRLIERRISEEELPNKNKAATRSGLFGEFLSEEVMIKLNGYNRFIHKLRHRESSNWAPRLVDICVFKNRFNPVLCMIEVKTNSSKKRNGILSEGFSSLLKALQRKNEALNYIARILELREDYDDADFVRDLATFEEYEQENEICIVVDPNFWDPQAFKELPSYTDQDEFDNLSVRLLLVKNLAGMIDEVHSKALEIGSDPDNALE